MGQGQGTSLGSMVGGYEPPLGDLAKGYLKNLEGGLINMPTFQQMFGAYEDVARQNAAKAGANITESFGSQGARYGSDLLRAQGQNQRDLNLDLLNAASGFQLDLRKQQAGEIGSAVDFLNSRDVLGMNYLWQDYLRRTSPPPLLGAASGAPGSPPGPVGY